MVDLKISLTWKKRTQQLRIKSSTFRGKSNRERERVKQGKKERLIDKERAQQIKKDYDREKEKESLKNGKNKEKGKESERV